MGTVPQYFDSPGTPLCMTRFLQKCTLTKSVAEYISFKKPEAYTDYETSISGVGRFRASVPLSSAPPKN